ncbi:shikimate dehydrogenase [Crocinitomix catalasitica]|nr:shikimate dehydrogenase [Crocinitomix catalasitica]
MEESFRKYGLIGRSLKHSFSSDYFRNKFAKGRIRATYENVEILEISMVVDVLKSGRYSGLNVTIPYKESIVPFLDEVDVSVESCGVANTLHFIDGKWIGYNTDIFGFKQSIKPFFKSQHERSVILGTGGASKAVASVLEELGSNVIYISRSPDGQNKFSYDDLNEAMLKAYKLIVNCTPVGMFPNSNAEILFPYEYLSPDHLCIDLIYNPKETVFLRKSKEHGAAVLNGESMLHQQAEKAWEIWNS